MVVIRREIKQKCREGGDQLNDKCVNNREGIEPLLKSLHKRNTEYYITFCTPYEI